MNAEGSRQLDPKGDRVDIVGDTLGSNELRGELFRVCAEVDVLH